MSILSWIRNKFSNKPNIIVVAGQTATGKSDLAVELALRHNGEIISADSRQVYRSLDLGSGKITHAEMRGVPHHMLDVTDVVNRYTVAEYKQAAQEAIEDILSRGKLPIICGGTGFYIDTLVYNQNLPNVAPNEKLRAELEKKPDDELFLMIQSKAPKNAETIDRHNRTRLVRALEILDALGYIPVQTKKSLYRVLWLGLRLEPDELKSRIYKRIVDRIDQGMITEVRNLLGAGIPYERLQELGLEYRYISSFLKNEVNQQAMVDELVTKTNQFAKRQRTWFKRNKLIHWFHTVHEREVLFDKVEAVLD